MKFMGYARKVTVNHRLEDKIVVIMKTSCQECSTKLGKKPSKGKLLLTNGIQKE